MPCLSFASGHLPKGPFWVRRLSSLVHLKNDYFKKMFRNIFMEEKNQNKVLDATDSDETTAKTLDHVKPLWWLEHDEAMKTVQPLPSSRSD